MARLNQQSGVTLIEMLVGMLIGSLVLSTAFAAFLDTTWRGMDLNTIAKTNERARAIVDLMVYDLRMMGSGMPLGQSGFVIGGTGMGTAPYPIFNTVTSTLLSFRMNEKGVSTVLSANNTPSSSALTFSVLSSSNFSVGKTVYISNMPTGGSAGLMGTIASTTATTITLASGYTATATTTFNSGSTVEPVTNMIYTSNTSGITRNAEFGAVVLAPNSSFTASYLNNSATAMTLPLTNTNIANDLAAISVSVSIRSESKLHNRSYYTALATETVGLRNLNLNR